MKAAVLHGPGDLRVEEVPDPPVPRPDEVTIAVHRCGLCGTDAHEYAHGGPMTPLRERHPWSGHLGPTIIGHEFMGTVTRAGTAAGFAEGARIVAGAGHWCGDCPPCRAGRTNLCRRYHTYGLSTHGGMAEFVTVPAAMCAGVPDGCTDDNAALAQPVSIAMHALDRGQVPEDSEILVIGAGGVGALLVAAAADRGLTVHVADLDPVRLAAARRLGAATTQQVDGQTGATAFRGLATVFETSGAAAGLRMALDATAPGGRIVAVGLPGGTAEFDLRAAVVSEKDIRTSSAHVCRRDLPAAVDLLSRLDLATEIVARVLPLDRIHDGLAGGGKTLIDIRGKE
ncbi:2,3-butanediol dehydrogenase [Amycolatopsis endophytica]|uniref:(R,R)-butanediol dehydrogenase/meso-butanediol dehydrogenase/diacetyl reductase n=1 Tax=Amycolatopsis endophytica TaxID=860233 RepID=A0A853BEH2_9PSEU|nr:alcohol dehydrogenase catalytic domain-containing protein [Amycolatopsis endophytica]NYI92987.1 (R,R)-butanediol dehydrogenase/meso-butanediol dehydrogenase/diacetyl reductase [Amycolatopsis endophytica]